MSYQLATNPSYVSPCDVNATVHCTDAYMSAYGSIRGIPVALLGLGWFVAALLLQVSAPATGGALAAAWSSSLDVTAASEETALLHPASDPRTDPDPSTRASQ